MIWIVSKSGMSAQFLEACINNVDLTSDQKHYDLIQTPCKFGYFLELNHIWRGIQVPVKKPTQEPWKDEWYDGFSLAKGIAESKGHNALFTHRHDKELIQWMIEEGDSVIVLRHINHLPLWICRESVLDKKHEKTVSYFLQKLKSRLIELDTMPDHISEQPYLDQNDFLTLATRQLQKLAPCMDIELFKHNLDYYVPANLKGITNWDMMTEIIIKHHSSHPLITWGYDDLINTDLTF